MYTLSLRKAHDKIQARPFPLQGLRESECAPPALESARPSRDGLDGMDVMQCRDSTPRTQRESERERQRERERENKRTAVFDREGGPNPRQTRAKFGAGLGSRVQGSGFRGQGSGFRV